MAIHINLLAEAQAAEELRRRDPVKRAVAIGVLLVLAALVWSGTVKLEAIAVKGHLDSVQAEISAKANSYQRVMTDDKAIMAAQARLTALEKLQTNRFLQGDLLNALQHSTVENVQLTRLREDQVWHLTPGAEAQTNGEQVTPGRPAVVTEKINVYLDAHDYSPNPGDQVNAFMQAIARQSYFHSMLEKTNGVQLASSPSAPQNDGARVYVTFTLDCRYPEMHR